MRKAYLPGVVLFVAAAVLCQQVIAVTKTKLSTPSISCVSSTDSTITVQFCAGASGTPAGFTIEWMTLADFQNGTQYNAPGQWPTPAQTDRAFRYQILCKYSYSANARGGSQWAFTGQQCQNFVIGDPSVTTTSVNGVSTNCPGPLDCGTEYVFRAFAHADKTHYASDFSNTVQCDTEPCP
jgi:hypothetical protein